VVLGTLMDQRGHTVSTVSAVTEYEGVRVWAQSCLMSD
jgi:hypothetical protein